ncbi:hypothetical protein HMPREF2811_03455 [Globicatella sp. HMSC072A10]|uniref:ATP-grasp domain-containing protein n=1 Tax=Globicatella sp. HMSC072A10 TaxID=1739315 RepID=UPI0008D16BC2|nr:ATP-grasp domain-containing protein [Globicatella sp. HMSC072A10]OFK60931.1 hypothetical protein HMPREF2811_03455 [Globicatella sp. HMSC072A10]
MPTKKIMILGASILQVPLINQVNKNGYSSIVLDYNPNSVGRELADEFYEVSTIDTEKVLEIASKIKPDAILTAATDMPIRTVAYVSEQLGLKSLNYETACICTDKHLMAEKLINAKVSTPNYFYLDITKELNINDFTKLNFPIIIKPTDSSGSRGVIKVENINDISEAVNYSSEISKNKKLIVQEFIEGEEVSVECLVNDGEISVVQVTDKETTGSPHFVELGHKQPSRLPEEVIEKINDLAKDAIKVLNINNSAAHIEMRIEDGTPYIIEVGARLGGDFITSHLTPLSTGTNMVQAIIDISLDEKPIISSETIGYSRVFFFSKNVTDTNLEKIKEKYKNEIIEFFYESKHDTIEILSSSDRIGHVIFKTKTLTEMLEIESLMQQILN